MKLEIGMSYAIRCDKDNAETLVNSIVKEMNHRGLEHYYHYEPNVVVKDFDGDGIVIDLGDKEYGYRLYHISSGRYDDGHLEDGFLGIVKVDAVQYLDIIPRYKLMRHDIMT